MTENWLRNRLGVSLIAFHLFILLLVLVLYALGGFSFDEMTTVIAIIVPVFAGYSTAVISYIVDSRFTKIDNSSAVTGLYAFLSFAFPTIFVLVIACAIVMQAYSVAFEDFEQFKKGLILLEGLFASYSGRLIFAIFKMEGKRSAGSIGNRAV